MGNWTVLENDKDICRVRLEEMMKVKIELGLDVELLEFKKSICFASEMIKGVETNGHAIVVDVAEEGDPEKIREDIINLFKKYVSTTNKEKAEFANTVEREYCCDLWDDDKLFHVFEPGVVSLNGKAQFLYDFMENEFVKLGKNMGAVWKRYPALLSIKDYQKTGYIKNSPQYSIFCANAHEDIKELEKLDKIVGTEELSDVLATPKFALSPSGCFYVYIEHKNKILDDNKMFTFTGHVFRNEGRFNYDEIGRLRDYHCTEIVFLGEEKFVKESRMYVIERIKELLIRWNLNGILIKASDPFIMPRMQKFKKIQLIDDSKYELKLNVSKDKNISVASFNLHGTAFSYPFNITMKKCEETVTGCVGFGIERWVIAFLSQYGECVERWPEDIRLAYYQNK
ncbi:amino acid--[acyl-carrier-protein] ligase [Clostridium tepidiprofundi DSM 19306]|uniref:Amino acid--[acyl-carrier-protein] ligase n=1 Tax=Clostridium tepidiprofundi DSM 19306 TaxID=1121338 RepID=A0A151B232_9CLOT|nr:aminoacyl--tRNA ligase-related protein [Clostridium tepidiprofundi]KYH33958.1 amino acid--[acyl-carrier-protein] ligase [Clostridium tepidiprofundi DSM 19306]